MELFTIDWDLSGRHYDRRFSPGRVRHLTEYAARSAGIRSADGAFPVVGCGIPIPRAAVRRAPDGSLWLEPEGAPDERVGIVTQADSIEIALGVTARELPARRHSGWDAPTWLVVLDAGVMAFTLHIGAMGRFQVDVGAAPATIRSVPMLGGEIL